MSNNFQNPHTPHPQQPNAQQLHNPYPRPSQPNTQPRTRISTAIVTGADRMLALIDQEKAKIDAHYQKQLSQVKAQFSKYHAAALKRESELSQRVRELEEQLSAYGNTAPLITSERTSQVSEGNTQAAPNNSDITPSTAVTPQNPVSRPSGGWTSPTLHAELDSWTIHTLNQLGLRTSTPQNQMPNSLAAALNLMQVDPPTKDFIPRLLQYLASQRKALQDWEAMYNTVKKECDELRRKLQQDNAPEQPMPLSSPNDVLQYPDHGIESTPNSNGTISKVEEDPTSALGTSTPNGLSSRDME